jgi:hypothetical protein
MGTTNKKKTLLIIFAVGIVAAVALAAWPVDYVLHQQWLLEDAQTLQSYKHVIFENEDTVDLANSSVLTQELSEKIIRHNLNRNILLHHVSISDPRKNLFGTRIYVKALIVTNVAGPPDGEERQRKVKVVYCFSRAGNGDWEVRKVDDRTIE